MSAFDPTSPPPPGDDDLDELVSAVIDGEGEPDEADRVAADADLAARADRFRSVAEAVGSSPGLPDDQARAQVLTAALAAAPEVPADQLAARRARRRVRLPSPVLAAAVIAVLLAVGLGLIVSGLRSTDQNTTTAASNDRPTASTTTSAAAESAAGADSARDATTSGSSGIDLGTYTDQEQLTRYLATLDVATLLPAAGAASTTTVTPSTEPAPGSTSESTPSTLAAEHGTAAPPDTRVTSDPAVVRCDTVVRSIPGTNLGPLRAVADATLDGRPVLILSHPRTDQPRLGQLTVTDAQSCQVLFAVQR